MTKSEIKPIKIKINVLYLFKYFHLLLAAMWNLKIIKHELEQEQVTELDDMMREVLALAKELHDAEIFTFGSYHALCDCIKAKHMEQFDQAIRIIDGKLKMHQAVADAQEKKNNAGSSSK